jgi:hypothetical protein
MRGAGPAILPFVMVDGRLLLLRLHKPINWQAATVRPDGTLALNLNMQSARRSAARDLP